MTEVVHVPFERVLTVPLRNGINVPSRQRGEGVKLVNMGELFAYDRLGAVKMELAPLPPGEPDRFLLERGDLLFARQSLVREGAGKCSIVLDDPEPRTWEGHLIRARVDRSIADPAFYYYWFKSHLGRAAVDSIVEQVAAAGIRGSDLAKLPVPLPPVATQRAIAGVLGALDDKIESNRRIIELLERTAAAEYSHATVDADDEPYAAALTVEMGAPFSGDHFSAPSLGRPLIRIRDLKTMEPQVWTTESRPDEAIVSAGDVLVGMDAEFRSTLWLGDSGVLNQRMCRFVPKPNVASAFAWFAIRPDLEYCERAKSGTTVIHLNKADINRFSVPMLSAEQHGRLKQSTEPLVDRLVSAGRESATLAALRDALLPELLSGRLRVREAERVVEGVV